MIGSVQYPIHPDFRPVLCSYAHIYVESHLTFIFNTDYLSHHHRCPHFYHALALLLVNLLSKDDSSDACLILGIRFILNSQ